MLTTAEELSPEQWTQPTGFSWGSLHGTLVHTMDSKHLYQSNVIMPRYSPADFPILAAFWKQEKNEMHTYLNSLSDSEPDSILRYEVEEGVRGDADQFWSLTRWYRFYAVYEWAALIPIPRPVSA